jgi:hypothetical protein
MKRLRVKPTIKQVLVGSISCLVLCGCRNSAKPENAVTGAGNSQAKIYAMDDVDKELKEGMVALGGTRDDARAFFKAHTEFRVCQDMESFLVAVVKNTKVDPRADDIYVIANYERDGKIGGLDIGPPQFSVSNPASYCK